MQRCLENPHLHASVGSPSLVSSCADSYCASQYCLQLCAPRKNVFCLCHLRAWLLLYTVLCGNRCPATSLDARSFQPNSRLSVWCLFYTDVRGISHDFFASAGESSELHTNYFTSCVAHGLLSFSHYMGKPCHPSPTNGH